MTPRPQGGLPLPTITAAEAGNYPEPDIREVDKNPVSFLKKNISIRGTVLTVKQAAEGRTFFTPNNLDKVDYQSMSYLQMVVSPPRGAVQNTVVIFVLYDGDTSGIFEGSTVSAHGPVIGTTSFQNSNGGTISQPLMYAQLVLK